MDRHLKVEILLSSLSQPLLLYRFLHEPRVKGNRLGHVCANYSYLNPHWLYRSWLSSLLGPRVARCAVKRSMIKNDMMNSAQTTLEEFSMNACTRLQTNRTCMGVLTKPKADVLCITTLAESVWLILETFKQSVFLTVVVAEFTNCVEEFKNTAWAINEAWSIN